MCKALDLKTCTQKGPGQGYASSFLTPEQLQFDCLFNEPFICKLQPHTLLCVSERARGN